MTRDISDRLTVCLACGLGIAEHEDTEWYECIRVIRAYVAMRNASLMEDDPTPRYPYPGDPPPDRTPPDEYEDYHILPPIPPIPTK